jgi:hypothetical protein
MFALVWQVDFVISKKWRWILENLTDKIHIRGALKAYRKNIQQIGGLKAQMGWDTVDELLCKFYNWKVVTDATASKALENLQDKLQQNSALQTRRSVLHFGIRFIITAIASAKLMKKNLYFFRLHQRFWKRSCQNSIVGN